MRVTIGERLGLITKDSKVVRSEPRTEAPEPFRMDPVGQQVDLKTAPSSSLVPPERTRNSSDAAGPERVRGEMVWLHKTAPTLVIQGRADLTPDDHENGRRR